MSIPETIYCLYHATNVQMMKEKGSSNHRMLHLILHGMPASGKTCAKLRLTGQTVALACRKPAEYFNGKLVYPSNGSHSTPIAEGIIRARLTASTTVFATEADDQPWHLVLDYPLQDKPKCDTLIYIVDSGGQPQFQELLPIFMSGPSVFLLTFSLADSLDAVYKVQFADKDGKRENYPTNLKIRDVLIQSLASIRCTCSYQTNGEERVEVKPRVIFMATMRSLVSDEKIADIDRELKCLVEPFSELIVYNGTGVFFPVDSFTGDGIQALRGAVRCTADCEVTKVTGGVSYSSPMCEVKLLTTAVALEQILQKQERGIISLKQCKQLAISCNIDIKTDLSHILWVLHYYTGSIRYYPEDPILGQFVVTSPMKLYDIPSTLLIHKFAFKKKGELDYDLKRKVWTRGLFTMGTLRKLWGQDQDLTPELIVAFLTHLNIIVQMPYDEKSGEKPFFMPSALVCAPDDCFANAKVCVDSVLVCFNGGYSPKGIFSSVIAYLPKEREGRNEPANVNLKWHLPNTKDSLCCNQATLVVCFDDEFDLLVKLTLHLKFIEIAVDSESKEDPASPAQLQLGCETILHEISCAVQIVSHKLHYNKNATLKNGLHFPCNCFDQGYHAAEYLPKKKKGECHGRSSKPNQLWMQKWTKPTASPNK